MRVIDDERFVIFIFMIFIFVICFNMYLENMPIYKFNDNIVN